MNSWITKERRTKIFESHILLVDDSLANLALLKAHLNKQGFQRVSTVMDAESVLTFTTACQPDAVITDYHMPRQDGLEMTISLRQQQGPECFLPILMVTSDTRDSLKQRALEAGVNDFLSRPIDPEELLLRLSNLLHTRVLYQQTTKQNNTLQQNLAAYSEELTTLGANAESLAVRYAQLAALSTRLEMLDDPLQVVREGFDAFMHLYDFDVRG